MILTQRLLYKLDLRLNKKATLDHQSIPVEDKILALNEAQIKLIKRKLNQNNIYQLGLDAFTKRYEDLQRLVVSFEELAVTKNTTGYPAYTGDLDALTNTYFLPLDTYVLCSKGSCTERPLAITRIIKHGDLHVLLSNSNWAPSFEYQETMATISGNKISVYVTDFKVDKLYISYLRYPTKINIEGYTDFDGSASTTQNCELPESMEDELLDLAVLEIAMETENTPQVQYTNQIRNQINE